MTRLHDRLAFQFASFGRIGALGAGLLLAALAIDHFLLQPLEAKRDALVEGNRMARIALPVRTASSTDQAAQALEAGADLTLRRLFTAAAGHGLMLDQGDYAMSTEKNGNVQAYQISLPVSGRYAALRDFLAQALNETPALALAHVSLSRDTIEETDLRADLRFTLFLKGDHR